MLVKCFNNFKKKQYPNSYIFAGQKPVLKNAKQKKYTGKSDANTLQH